MLQAIIFDMDGVLVESVRGMRESLVKVFEHY
jgi:beta-phosphoglucomutase-like phosphatase (HAD superfamily)